MTFRCQPRRASGDSAWKLSSRLSSGRAASRVRITRRGFLFLTAGTPLAGSRVAGFPAQTKPSPAQLLGHHLESLGPEQARSQILYREARGACTRFGRILESRGRSFLAGGKYSGSVELLLSHSHFRMTMLFESDEYLLDAMIFDGNSVRVAWSGTRETGRLAGFLSLHDTYLEEGLFGGVLSVDWRPLRDRNDFSDLRVSGRKRFKGEDCQRLRLELPSSKQSVTMYFSTETGRHIGTDYGLSPVETGVRLGTHRQDRLVESFSDFQKYGGLTLPAFWGIEIYSTLGKERWEIHFQSISHTGPQLKRPSRGNAELSGVHLGDRATLRDHRPQKRSP